jgi:hypothetical protein
MILNNTQEIRTEDFEQDDQQLIARLAEIINPFMRQVVELSDNRIDFENTTQVLRQVEFTVDQNGVPVQNNQLNAGKSNIRGFQVISAFNLDNPQIYTTSQPFLNYVPIGGNFVEIKQINGLVANNRYRLTIVVY